MDSNAPEGELPKDTSDLFGGGHTRQKTKLKKKEKFSARKSAQKHKEVLEAISVAAGQPSAELVADVPTAHLFVAISGQGASLLQSEVAAALSEHAPLERMRLLAARSIAVASYASPAVASTVRSALDGQHCMRLGRVLRVEFALDSAMPAIFAAPAASTESTKPSAVPGMCLAAEDVTISGLHLKREWVSEGESDALMELMEAYPWNSLKYRRVQHYGYAFDYSTNNVNKAAKIGPLPGLFAKIAARIAAEFAPNIEFDQLTVNEYMPGQGIKPHVDTHSAFEEPVVSLSLIAPIAMDLRHPNGVHVSVLLPPRSLLVLSGESRYAWTHGIAMRKSDVGPDGTTIERTKRVSLTFRKIRHTPCDCNFSAQCDSQLSAERADGTTRVEARFVHDVYEAIAPHFSATRYKPWPRVQNFLLSLEPGSIVADVGCGNGKYLGVNPALSMLGSDRSHNLVAICRNRSFEAMVCDTMRVPYRSAAFDAAISIAVIHHLSTEEHRLRALRELLRIVRVGGQVLVYVWALEQTENTFFHQDLFVPWDMSKYKPNEDADDLASRPDAASKFQRYYHVFREGELEALVKSLPNTHIEEAYFDHANWCVRIRKTKP